MPTTTIAGFLGSNLPLTFAVLIVGIAFLYWAFTCGANDKLVAKTNRELGRAEGFIECLLTHCDFVPKLSPVPSQNGEPR